MIMADNYLHSDITSLIIKGFYVVYNRLGFGFLEKVYQNALLIELRKYDLDCVANKAIELYYDEYKVGLYYADIVVNNCVIIENKASEELCPAHEAQLVNYLKATDFEVGLLLNFGQTPDIKRKVFSKEFKS